jgi:putative selenium metabolism protein SsnA
MTTTVVRGGSVTTAWVGGQTIEAGAVGWRDGRIVAVGPEAEVHAACPEAEILEARGGIIGPGLINLHHHFYSTLSRGLDPGDGIDSFGAVLDRLWWRLDRALNDEAVRLSAEMAVAECARWGCTTVFDHHASPSCIPGILDVVAEVVETAGLAAVLCYEVTDRNGRAGAAAGLEESRRFAAAAASRPRLGGMIGLHASFTVREGTLAAVAASGGATYGCHLHAAEGRLDVEASRREFGASPVERLERHGLLGPKTLLAHGVHLDRADLERVAAADATIVHAPESNANNAVGRLDLPAVLESGSGVGLGTDGMSSAMLRSLRAAFLLLRHGRGAPVGGFLESEALLERNVAVARRVLAEPLLGVLAAGAPADLTVIDAPPPTPLTSSNLTGHLLYAASEAPVRHTVAGGRTIMRDFDLTDLDVERCAARARELAPEVWRRFAEQSIGTPFLGE